MKKLIIGLFSLLLISFFLRDSELPEQYGRYSRVDNHRESRIELRKDGSASKEINTGWGVLNQNGTFTISENKVYVKWDPSSARFTNLLGPKPDLEIQQTFTLTESPKGDGWWLEIGSTTYFQDIAKK